MTQAPEFVKRSTVLTEDMVTALDEMALVQGRSFASLVRDAINFWITTKDSGFIRENDVLVTLSKEERKLIEKLAVYLPMNPSGILKQCWTDSLPRLLEQAQTRKHYIDEIAKTL